MAATVTLVSPADREIERVLRDLGYPHAVLAATGLQALARPSANVPELLLVDLRERPQLIGDLAAVRKAHPHVGVVILARLDPGLMLDAMRAGITECVTDPIDPRQLDACLKRLSASAPAATGEVFAFVGSKGGVGTTTLAVNTAAVLAKSGASVVFIDLNIAYGDAALYFGAEARFSIVDALDNQNRLDDAFLKSILVKTGAGVDLIASADRDPGRPVDFRGLRTLIDMAARHYKYVVLDVPRAGRAGVDPLEKATSVVIVSNHELAAVRSASHLAAGLRDRYGSARVSIVVSRFDRTSEIRHEDIERAVGESVRQTFPSDYRTALEALNKGRPLVMENHTKLAATIRTFAQGLAGITEQTKKEDARGSLFGMLTGRR